MLGRILWHFCLKKEKHVSICRMLSVAAVVASLAAGVGGTSLALAQGDMGGMPMQGGRGRGGAQAPANLGGAMGDMNRMLTAIKAEAADPANIDKTLHDLAQFERDVSIAKMQTPPVTRAKEKAPADATHDFRAAMSALQHTAIDLETAVTDKKPDDIKKLIAQLEDIQKQGHAEFHVGE